MNIELDRPIYEHRHVVHATGRSTGTVQTWVTRGYLIPASGQNPGYAQRRLYTAADVCQIAILGALVDFGLPPGEARQVALHVGGILADGGIKAVPPDSLLRVSRSPVTVPTVVRAAERIARGTSMGADETPGGEYEYKLLRGKATVGATEPVLMIVPVGALVADVLNKLPKSA